MRTVIAVLLLLVSALAFAQPKPNSTFVGLKGRATITTDSYGRVNKFSQDTVASRPSYVTTYASTPTSAVRSGSYCSANALVALPTGSGMLGTDAGSMASRRSR